MAKWGLSSLWGRTGRPKLGRRCAAASGFSWLAACMDNQRGRAAGTAS